MTTQGQTYDTERVTDERGEPYGYKLIAEAIEAHFGERNPDAPADGDDTTNWDVWAAFDALSPAPADAGWGEALRTVLGPHVMKAILAEYGGNEITAENTFGDAFDDAESELATIFASPAPAPAAEAVQDTWFIDSSLPIKAMSGDVDSNRVLKLHFRRPVTDADRQELCNALNVYRASLQPSPQEAPDLTPADTRDAGAHHWRIHKEPVRDARHALELLDDVDSLVRFCSVSMPDVDRYYRGSEAMWRVAHWIATLTRDAIAQEAPGGVVVKPLEWRDGEASSPVGGYRVQRLDDKWEPLQSERSSREAEIEALRRERDEARSSRDYQRGKKEVAQRAAKSLSDGIVHWKACATAAEAREAELRKALEPFDRAAFDVSSHFADSYPVVNVRGENPITAGHFRALRAALTASKEPTDEA